MITLEPITQQNFRAVVDMKLSNEQSKFVASNVYSLAQAWLYHDEARPYAICNDGTVVGFIMLDWDENERTVGIWRFMTATEHQHKGYGRAAMKAAIQLAEESGKFDLMHLDYVPENTVARDLYYSLGFRENGDIEEGEIIMTMRLTDTPEVGMLTADDDDIDEITELVDELKDTEVSMPTLFFDKETLVKAIDAGQIKRFTLYGETIGVAYNNDVFIASEYSQYFDDARKKQMTDKIDNFYNHIKNDMTVTLATACSNSVTMRVVSPVLYKRAILIFTAADSVKYKQLKQNPHCCISAGEFFAEATAEFFGKTMLPENKCLRDAYCEKFPGAFDENIEFGGNAAEFILLKPTLLSGWAFENDLPSADGVPTVPFRIAIG